jgi:hypothetical protein
MDFSLNFPINSVSFGQVCVSLLREMYKRDMHPCLFPVGNVDLSSQPQDKEFFEWIQSCIDKSSKKHDRSVPVIKLWHLNGSLESFSEKQILITFHELDKPTETEVNIAKNNHKLVFTSDYSKNVFAKSGVESSVVKLGFDNENFYNTNRDYFVDDKIVFNLVGKFEKRKHHEKIISSWVKKFGNNKNYYLNCAVFNTFLDPAKNSELIKRSLGGKEYFNVNMLGFMPLNTMYNDYLNCGNIVVGMSGGEGWGLPEFQSVCLGKHAVILNAHSYKMWANESNSVLVNPTGKIPAEDGMFFKKDSPFNQGNIFDFNEDEFIAACEESVERYKSNPINEEGVRLKEEFTYSNTLDQILSHL